MARAVTVVPDATEVHGVRCARRMGYTSPTPLQRAVLEHANAPPGTAAVRIFQSLPRTGKTVAVAMGSLLGVCARTRYTQSLLLCSTIEQRDHTTWTVCRMLGENANHLRVVSATPETSRRRWRAANAATAHVLVGCMGTICQLVMCYPEILGRVRFVAVHDADMVFGTANAEQTMQTTTLMRALDGRARVSLVSTTYSDAGLRCIRAVVNEQTSVGPTDARGAAPPPPGTSLRARGVRHMSVMVEREWKGDMAVHVTEWALRWHPAALVLVSCTNGPQVDRVCAAFHSNAAVAGDRVDVVGIHGQTERRQWAHRRLAQGGVGGRGLVVVATEGIAHDARGGAFDVVVCGDAPFGIEGMLRLVSRARARGAVVHLLTRDDAITFQRTMRAHGVPVVVFEG